jgi:hypothetical protein
VSDASAYDPVSVFARELFALGTVVGIMRSAIGIPFEGDRRNDDLRQFRKAALEVGIFGEYKKLSIVINFIKSINYITFSRII